MSSVREAQWIMCLLSRDHGLLAVVHKLTTQGRKGGIYKVAIKDNHPCHNDPPGSPALDPIGKARVILPHFPVQMTRSSWAS